MNIHPIFVHFPIALFTLFSILELLRFRLKQPYWFYVKAVLVISGFLSAVATIFTGLVAAESLRGSSLEDVVAVHASFAISATFIFMILAWAYFVAWVNSVKRIQNNNWLFFTKIQKFLIETNFAYILTILGLIAITVTGALGGSMVYGPEVDPFVSFVYHLFFRE